VSVCHTHVLENLRSVHSDRTEMNESRSARISFHSPHFCRCERTFKVEIKTIRDCDLYIFADVLKNRTLYLNYSRPVGPEACMKLITVQHGSADTVVSAMNVKYRSVFAFEGRGVL